MNLNLHRQNGQIKDESLLYRSMMGDSNIGKEAEQQQHTIRNCNATQSFGYKEFNSSYLATGLCQCSFSNVALYSALCDPFNIEKHLRYI